MSTGTRPPPAPHVAFVRNLTALRESSSSTENDDDRVRSVALAKARAEVDARAPIADEQVASFLDGGLVQSALARDGEEMRAIAAELAACKRALEAGGADARTTLANVQRGLTGLRAATAGARARLRQLHALMTVDVGAAEATKLATLLARTPLDRKEVLDFVARDLGGAALLREWSGTEEGYSLRVHSDRVLDALERERGAAELERISVPVGVRLLPTLRWLMTLHDIGKAAAVEHGDKELQHEFTTPAVVVLSQKLGFSAAETRLMRALVDNDVIGEVLHPEVLRDIDEASRELRALARDAGMSPKDYFALQTLFFTADASSYPDLHASVFHTVDGRLEPRDPRFHELRERLSH